MKSYPSLTDKVALIAKVFLIAGVFFVPISTALMNIGLCTAAILVLLTGQWHEKIAFIKARPALWISLPLFLLILISATHGIVPWGQRFTMVGKYHYLLMIPFLAWLFIEESTRTKALAAFLSAMVMIWILTYLLFYFGISVINHGNSTIFHDHISIGILSAFSVFAFIYLFRVSSGYKKYAYLALTIMGSWYMLFLNSGRTAYMVFLALFILIFFQAWRWKGVLFSGIVIAVLASTAFLFSSVFHNGVTLATQQSEGYLAGKTHTQDSYGSAGLRLVSIRSAIDLLKVHPIIGVGTGSFFQSAAALPWMTPEINTQPVSNELLNISVQTGFLGAILVLLIYFVQWRESALLPPRYAQIAKILIITMLVADIVGTPLVDAIEANFYGVFVALCFASLGKRPLKS